MRGIGGILLITAALVFGGQACSKKPLETHSRPVCSVPPSGDFMAANDHFRFGCDDFLKTIAYIEAVHLRGQSMNTNQRLKRAVRKIIGKQKIPTPYFIENTTGGSSYIPQYIYFQPLWNAFDLLQSMGNDFDYKKDICSVIENLSAMIETALSRDSDSPYGRPYDQIVPYIKALLYKGVLRYFVASLDPHSKSYEHLEDHYLKHQPENDSHKIVFELDQDENAFAFKLPNSPYHDYDKTKELQTSWLSSSQTVLKIEILKFTKDTTRLFREAYYQNRQSRRLTGLIIDLRRNRGGNALVVAELADLFIQSGLILYLKEKTTTGWKVHTRYATAGNELRGLSSIKVGVLVSRYSASSSETFAAAMQAHRKGIIIGERTFGKGTGQLTATIRALSIASNSCTMITLTQLYTYSPLGFPLQGVGITPDVRSQDVEYRRLIGKDNLNTDVFRFHYEEHTFDEGHALETPKRVETDFFGVGSDDTDRWTTRRDGIQESLGATFNRQHLITAFQ